MLDMLQYQALKGNKWAEMARALSERAMQSKKQRYRRQCHLLTTWRMLQESAILETLN